MEKNKEDEGEEVHINTMGSVSGEKEKGEETKEKDGDKIKKNKRRQKSKEKDIGEEEILDIKTDLKEPFRFRLSPLSFLEGDRGKAFQRRHQGQRQYYKKNFAKLRHRCGNGRDKYRIVRDSIHSQAGGRHKTVSRIIGLQKRPLSSSGGPSLKNRSPHPEGLWLDWRCPTLQKRLWVWPVFSKKKVSVKSEFPSSCFLGPGCHAGKSHFCQCGQMPHLLVAGATGSGKSIYIHSLITSLLYRNPPESLRFIMIDPKRVELTVYNDIPHMLALTIIETKKAIITLKWLAKEMERRYSLFFPPE